MGKTIEQLAAIIRNQVAPPRVLAVVPIQPMGSKAPFFMVGARHIFRGLAERLGLDQPFYGLHVELSELAQLPVPYRIEDIASCFVRAMREQQPNGPYHLGGYCYNGVIAYEMARQLVGRGQEVGLLALFEVYNPAYKEELPKGSRFNLVKERLRFHVSILRQMKMKETKPYILDRFNVAQQRARVKMLHLFYGLRTRLNRGRLRDSAEILNVAAAAYRPLSYPGRVVLFRTTKQSLDRYADVKLGWGELAASVEVHIIPASLNARREAADNISMFLDPEVQVLAGKMGACLQQASNLTQNVTGLAATST